MIKSILYSDVYRPMVYSLVSMFMVYCLRKEKTKIQIFFILSICYMQLVFFGIFSVSYTYK